MLLSAVLLRVHACPRSAVSAEAPSLNNRSLLLTADGPHEDLLEVSRVPSLRSLV